MSEAQQPRKRSRSEARREAHTPLRTETCCTVATSTYEYDDATVAMASARNARRHMEDTYLVHDPRWPERLVVGVFDGHGGTRISDALPRAFQDALSEDDGNTDVSALFRRVNDLVRADAEAAPDAGSTAVVAAIDTMNGDVRVGNLGDSRAIRVDPVAAGACTQVTRDHKPSDPEEAAAIAARGHTVVVDSDDDDGGPARVCGLAVSRSFGDTSAGTGIAREPEVHTCSLAPTATGAYPTLVLASDGLWDELTNEQVATCVHEAPSLADAARTLQARTSHDNVMVVLVRLHAVVDTE